MVLSTSDRVSFLAGPSPFAICEVVAAVFVGLGAVLDLTRSAHDFGGAGGEAGLGASADALGDVSVEAGTDVVDDRLTSSKLCSTCGAGEVEEITLTESRCCLDTLGLRGKMGTAGTIGSTTLLPRGCRVDVGRDLTGCGVIAEDGVVGSVDPVSEGASDVRVGVWTGVGMFATWSAGGSASFMSGSCSVDGCCT